MRAGRLTVRDIDMKGNEPSWLTVLAAVLHRAAALLLALLLVGLIEAGLLQGDVLRCVLLADQQDRGNSSSELFRKEPIQSLGPN